MLPRMLLTFALLSAGVVCGQDSQAVIIPVKTLSGDAFTRLVNLIKVFPAKISADEKLRTILVYAPKPTADEVRRIVEQLDQPGSEAAIGRNVDITLAFLRATTSPPAGTDSLPPDLEAVAKQIRAATQYKHFELWDVVPLRIQEGRQTDHQFRLPHKDPKIENAFATGTIVLRPEAVIRQSTGRSVRFDRVHVGLRVPYVTGSIANSTQFNFFDMKLDTAGDFKEGQKTVLGKVSEIGEGTAIFVVVSLKILD